jgi:hypothetical protein
MSYTVSRDLLESLVDDDPCWFDHNGGCQAHGYLALEPGEVCPQEELKRLLARPELCDVMDEDSGYVCNAYRDHEGNHRTETAMDLLAEWPQDCDD